MRKSELKEELEKYFDEKQRMKGRTGDVVWREGVNEKLDKSFDDKE
jgi:hypothetical protein